MEDRREVRYSLRLPPDLHAALEALARREDRSLNQQLVYLLRQGVRRAEQRGKASAAQRQEAPAPPERPGAGEPDQLRGSPQ